MKFGLTDTIIEQIQQVLETAPAVDKAFVFGSRAKGNYRESSDIDLALKGTSISFNDILKLHQQLEELNLPYEFDILTYHTINEPALVEHIDRVGIELYSRWKRIELRDICSEISYGYTASAVIQNVGPKFLRITDITSGSVSWEKVPYCNISAKEYQKYRLEVGDIVIARTGATTGSNLIIKEDIDAVFASYLIRFRIKKNIADPFFVGHALQSNNFQDYVDAIAGGSAQPGANAQQFADYEFTIPPLEDQISVSSILSSLDDKIALLQRQNKTLEQLAETLFRQWFIEDAEAYSSTQYLLCDLVKSVSVTHKFLKGEAIFLNTSDIYFGEVLTSIYSPIKSLPGQAKKTIQKDDILFSEIRPANGRWAYIDFNAEDYVVSTKLMVLRSRNIVSQAFVYFYLTHPSTVEWLSMIAESRSGTFPQITFEQLVNLKINIPSQEKLKEAELFCNTAMYKIKKNNKQILSLTQTRNELLPKLMSGEVRVKIIQ